MFIGTHPFYFISCLIVFFVSSDLTSSILVSYYAVNDLGGEMYQSNWMLTSYLAASAIGVIGSSWINDILNLRRSIFLCMLGICFFNLFFFSGIVLSTFTNVEIYRKIFHHSNLVHRLNAYPNVMATYL